MSIQTDAIDAYYAHQAAATGQRRLEFGPTANRVALKRQGRRERMLARLREGPATTLEMMMLGWGRLLEPAPRAPGGWAPDRLRGARGRGGLYAGA